MKHFRPFRFDEASGTLWRGQVPMPLTRKSADLLRLFLDHPGVPLTHQEIMRHVWPDTHVQPQNIKALVHEIRAALADDVQQPRFIRADPGRGYTFVADATDAPVPLCDNDNPTETAPTLCGRDHELAAVRRLVGLAATTAAPQVILIEGERGSGRTAFCRAIVEGAHSDHGAHVSLGEAPNLPGPVEPYAVVADALDLLARQYPLLVPAALQRHAPSWVHRASAFNDGSAHGPAQILRELARALDQLAQDVPLVLVLEDLQWSDPDTIAWIGAMARRRVPSKLVVVATYCGSDERMPANLPLLDRLSRLLVTEKCGQIVRLEMLTERDIASGPLAQFGLTIARVLAGPLAQATAGNARLVTNAIDALIDVGALRSTSSGWSLETADDGLDPVLASSLVGGFEWQVDQLSDADRVMLQAAAAAGPVFSAAIVASAIDNVTIDVVTRRLIGLARRQVLVRPMPPADGRMFPSTFAFLHPVAADVLGVGIAIPARIRLAKRLEDRGEIVRRA